MSYFLNGHVNQKLRHNFRSDTATFVLFQLRDYACPSLERMATNELLTQLTIYNLFMELNYYLQYYFFYLENTFTGYPMIIRWTSFLVLVLLIIFLFSVVRFLSINFNQGNLEKKRNKIDRQLANTIKGLIFDTANLNQDKIEHDLSGFTRLIRSKSDKLVFTDLLISYLQTEKDAGAQVNSENFKAVLLFFGIPGFWEKEMMSNSSDRRREAIRKIDDLGNGCAGSLILRSAYHKNNGLRKQARAASLKYDNNDPFQFLDDSFDSDFNALDKVLIHHFLVKRSEMGALPLLTRWVIGSKNDLYKAFLIKEIGFFNQVEACPILADLLSTAEHSEVQCALIETLGELNYQSIEGFLIKNYTLMPKPVQSSSIKAISNFATDAGLNFLTNIFAKTFDSDLKIHLAYSIKSFGDKGQLKLDELSAQSTAFDKKIVDQVNYQFV